MYREYFILLLLVHVLGDYYVQTENMAKNKDKDIVFLIKHCAMYWITCFIISIPVISLKIVFAGVVVAISHAIVDGIKFFYIKNKDIDIDRELVILIFISIGQYSAIGLALTAKSIVRYDEITKNKISSEYYLIGTLLSLVFVIITSLVVLD